MFKLLFFILYIFTSSLFALSATGFASTPDMAKKAALQELVFQIKSTIDSSIDIKENVVNDKADQDVKNNIKMRTKGFLLGVTYSDITYKADYYRVTATLSDEALSKSIKNLYSEILKPLDVMSKKQKRLTLEKIDYLKALLKYKSIRNVKLSKVAIIEKKLNQELNFAKILFKTDSKAKIEIANRNYNANEYFYLEPANYKYTIHSDGYYDESGVFYAQAGYCKIIKKKLIAKKGILNIYIKSDKKFHIKSDILSMLSNYGVKNSKKVNADYIFEYKFEKESVMKLGTSEFYRFSLYVNVYKNSKFLFTKKATLKRVVDSKLNVKAHMLAKVLTKNILKKL